MRVTKTNTRVYHSTEFQSKALDVWAYQHGGQLDFIPPGRRTQNDYIESFNDRTAEGMFPRTGLLHRSDARDKLERGRRDLPGLSSARMPQETAHRPTR